MITATYKLNWQGEPYKRRLLRELQRATRQGAERVRRTAKDPLLNVSGKTFTTKTGLNEGTLAERWNRGVKEFSGLSIINLGPKQLAFGGSYVHQKNGKSMDLQRIYWYGEPLHRWVQSSPPKQPPHKQTGTLQRSIAVEVVDGGLRAKIGPGNQLKYGRIHELGGKTRFGTLPPRPYMRPALNTEIQRIMFGFEMAIARASK